MKLGVTKAPVGTKCASFQALPTCVAFVSVSAVSSDVGQPAF